MALATGGAAADAVSDVSVSSASIVQELDNGLEAIPPMYVEDSEYNGVEISTTFACYHGLQPARRVAWDGVHAGRRFLGCPYEICCKDEDECNFVAWVDGQWPHRVCRTIELLWRTVDRATERSQAQVSRWYELHKEKVLAEEEKNKAISMVLALERKRKTQVERMELSLRRKRRLLLLSNVMIALLLIILCYVIAVKD